jgi:ABC-type dipeptide/oligopeptide/nickel transport system permease subunit
MRGTDTTALLSRLSCSKSAVFGLSAIVLVLLCAIFAGSLAPNDPAPSPPDLAQNLKPGFWSPNGADGMPLGSDALGRCVLSRIIYGARISLVSAALAVCIATLFGTILGGFAGYFGGLADAVFMRIVDIMFAFPALLLALAIVAVLGRGLDRAMIAIGIVYTPQMARIVRSSVLSIRGMEYIEAQRAIGSSDWRIVFSHVLPNCMAPMIVYATLMLGIAILECSALGFLGMGAQPPTPEWGAMLSESYKYVVSGAWWAATFPGIAIVLTVMSFNLLGDGLRDALDPRLKL